MTNRRFARTDARSFPSHAGTLAIVWTGAALFIACGTTQPDPRKMRTPPAQNNAVIPVTPPEPERRLSEPDAGAREAGEPAGGVVLEWPSKLATRGSRFEPTVAVTSDGSRVAATLASEDYHARGVAVVIWDGATGRELRRLAVDAESVAFDPDGNLFMTAAGALQIVPPSDGAPARTLRAAGGFVRVSPDGAWAATYAGKWSTDLVITSRQGTSAVLLPSQKGTLVQHVTFALDASRLCVVTSGGGDDRPTGRTRVVVFDLVGGRWKRGATHDVGPAQQADRATMLSRAQVWIDDRIVDLSSGSSAAAPVPTEPLQIAVDGRTVLFDNGTGVGHQLVSIEDGQPRQWLEVQRPRAGAGQAEAVSARGHVVWCTAGSCVIGPPLF